MFGRDFLRDEDDAVRRTWRVNATHVALIVVSTFGLPLVACVLMGKLIVVSWPARWATLGVYVSFVFALLLPKSRTRARAAILISSLYVLTIIQLALNGLVGDGRIGALALPLVALILLGAAEGWTAAGLSTMILAAFTVLAGTGTLREWQVIKENSLDPEHWLLQGVLLLAALTTLMILFTRFLGLQNESMLAERQSRRALENESSKRRLLEAELLRVSDEERARLGAELHDGLGQDLLVITNQAQLSLSRETNTPGAAARLREIIETSTHALDHARRMVHNLRPGLLEELGLTRALRAMAEKVAQASGLPVGIDLAEIDGLLSPKSELNLFRIAQEGLNNVLKHAEAANASITLSRKPDLIRLVVEDDGCGFERERPHSTGQDRQGLGLHQIALRTNMVGGHLKLLSQPGKGTRLVVEVPVRNSGI